MALDPTPWLVGNGAEHSPEVVRQALYDSTGGAEGVSSVDGLRVAALATPGTSVRVYPGGALLNNRYAGGAGQSYSARNASQTEVPIKATGSGSARTDLIVIRVLDPQYEGSAPADPNDFQYTRLEVIEGVSASTKSARDLSLSYPAVALAKVTLPKSTATVTAGMIEDLREVANPREKTVMIPRPAVTGDNGMVLSGRQEWPDGEWFPNFGGQDNNGIYYVDVPEWATLMQVRMEWIGVRYAAKAGYGWYWITWGLDALDETPSHYSQAFGWDSDETANPYRTNWIAAQEAYVPWAWRGNRVAFVGRANQKGDKSTYPGAVELTALSGMNFEVRFMEVADKSTS